MTEDTKYKIIGELNLAVDEINLLIRSMNGTPGYEESTDYKVSSSLRELYYKFSDLEGLANKDS